VTRGEKIEKGSNKSCNKNIKRREATRKRVSSIHVNSS